MNPIVVHIVSGWSFFTGAALVALGLTIITPERARWRNVLGRLVAILGVIAMFVSATPFPLWTVVLGGTVLLGWLVIAGSARCPRTRQAFRVVAAAVVLVGASIALAWQLGPNLPPVEARRIDVIGDSISVGLEGAEPWTVILSREHDVDVRSHAQVSATAASALKQARAIEPGPTLVLLEIGGNDLLGSTTSAEFESDLDELLTAVVDHERVVVLFELPCPPTYEAFGRIQRRLAHRHGVHLVPRRVLVGILATGDATLDSIHLTPAGHERMAEIVWSIVRPAFDE